MLLNKIKTWQNRSLSPDRFLEINNKIAIIRNRGGLGDILMYRMMFEDFKILNPNIKITLAIPERYIDAVKDHPFLDEVIDCKTINLNNYIIYYETSAACSQYERKIAPKADKHRSDIWANFCGVNLTKHNMHIRFSEAELLKGKEILNNYRYNKKPIIIFCPISTTPAKNLLPEQQKIITDYLKDYCVLGLHTQKIETLNVPTISGLNIREWMAVINEADAVISVDTAAFHLAGGLNKPLMGIYTFACGKTYGQYYDFVLVQKHRDNGDWPCGPCYKYSECPITKDKIKPCLSQISEKNLIEGLEKLLKNNNLLLK